MTVDAQLIQLWVHGRSRHTRRYYQADAQRFLSFVGKPLTQVSLADVQEFADSLETSGLASSSCGRTISSVKSLLAFGNRIGMLPINVGATLKAPTTKNTLTERILSEAEVQKLIVLEPNSRNQVMLKLLYAAGLRVSELCNLRWRDLQARSEAEGQINIYGKGGKTRVVLLPATIWKELVCLRDTAGFNDAVFSSRKGGHLHPSQAMRIVRAAAHRAGIDANVSPHWLRHAHASHSLDRGAPIHLIQQTLGHANIATTSRYLHVRPNDSSSRFLPL